MPQPEPAVLPTRYLVSCLPEGHDERWTFTIQIEYHGDGLYTVKRFLRYADADGTWEYKPDFDYGSPAEALWTAAHRFDHDTALALARRLAPTLTCHGRTVADALTAPSAHA